ncbi:MAG: type IV secretion system protein [Proteobacteria bacterium]|jgi:type IV secretory pathway TrbF-like protein|nr:type IV secretion system protein [Pseudomonadota bacterium]
MSNFMQNNKKIKQSNVFLSHIEQDGWNDIQAYHIENSLAWRNIAIIAIFALVVVALVSMYLVNQDKHKTLVYEKDSTGNITFLGLATKTFNIDNKVVAHQLANFIIALREVPSDIAIRRRNIDTVHKMIDPKIQVGLDKMIIGQYTKANSNQILVDITSIKPLQGGKSWVVNWVEHVSELSTSWSTTVTFELLETVEPDVQLVNPIGLFVRDIHPTQDIN